MSDQRGGPRILWNVETGRAGWAGLGLRQEGGTRGEERGGSGERRQTEGLAGPEPRAEVRREEAQAGLEPRVAGRVEAKTKVPEGGQP